MESESGAGMVAIVMNVPRLELWRNVRGDGGQTFLHSLRA